jgi:hypothetical protein
MKKSIYYIAFLTFLFAGSCKQEMIELQPVVVEPPPPACPDGASKGSADFTKFIAIGSSYTAGFQAGALFDDGQNNSLPAILNKQFQCVGAPATFNQPAIKSALGYNIFVTPNPDASQHVFGRFLLQYNGKPAPVPTPQLSNVAALPNPAVNPAFIYGNGSTKAALNNFGVQVIVLGQALIPQTGAWSGAGTDPRFNPFYGRLAYPGNGSSLIGDAAAAGGTFFMFWLGMDDFMLYSVFGGDGTLAPMTDAAAFADQYRVAIGILLGSNSNLKGVVGNFPDIFVMPHFTSVRYNPIPLDAATAAAVSSGFAGYNAALAGLVANAAAFGVSASLAAEIGTRKVTFAAITNNPILIKDETLTDLGPYFDKLLGAGIITSPQRAQLQPYQLVRQTTSTDIIPLSAGTILGTVVGGNPLLVNGVSVPLADRYVLIPSEISAIQDRRASFNSTIAATVAANSRLALADVNAGMASLVSNHAGLMNNITITPNIDPPTGIYSEDGIHPNTRGYAYLSTVFISAINAKYGATIPLTNLSLYGATALPIP